MEGLRPRITQCNTCASPCSFQRFRPNYIADTEHPNARYEAPVLDGSICGGNSFAAWENIEALACMEALVETLLLQGNTLTHVSCMEACSICIQAPLGWKLFRCMETW
eukprot:1157454-Pelagomonas_calceolata.AAC.7